MNLLNHIETAIFAGQYGHPTGIHTVLITRKRWYAQPAVAIAEPSRMDKLSYTTAIWQPCLSQITSLIKFSVFKHFISGQTHYAQWQRFSACLNPVASW